MGNEMYTGTLSGSSSGGIPHLISDKIWFRPDSKKYQPVYPYYEGQFSILYVTT